MEVLYSQDAVRYKDYRFPSNMLRVDQKMFLFLSQPELAFISAMLIFSTWSAIKSNIHRFDNMSGTDSMITTVMQRGEVLVTFNFTEELMKASYLSWFSLLCYDVV